MKRASKGKGTRAALPLVDWLEYHLGAVEVSEGTYAVFNEEWDAWYLFTREDALWARALRKEIGAGWQAYWLNTAGREATAIECTQYDLCDISQPV